MIFRLCGRKKPWWNKSTKSMVQLDEFAITISLGLASRIKKLSHVFWTKSHESLGTPKNVMLFNGIRHGHILSTFGTEMFVLFWDVFVLSQVLLLKDIGNSHQEGPLLKIIQPKLATQKADGYQDPNHVLSWHGGPLKTKQKSNALMVLFSTTTWDRIISHRIQWILLEDMNETCSVKIGRIPNVKTPSLFYWNPGGNSHPNRYKFCESTVCHVCPPWNQ